MRSKAISNALPVSISQAQPLVLTKKQVAQILQVKPATVYEMTRRRSKAKLPFFKAGKELRFEQGAVFRWIAEQQTQRAA